MAAIIVPMTRFLLTRVHIVFMHHFKGQWIENVCMNFFNFYQRNDIQDIKINQTTVYLLWLKMLLNFYD